MSADKHKSLAEAAMRGWFGHKSKKQLPPPILNIPLITDEFYPEFYPKDKLPEILWAFYPHDKSQHFTVYIDGSSDGFPDGIVFNDTQSWIYGPLARATHELCRKQRISIAAELRKHRFVHRFFTRYGIKQFCNWKRQWRKVRRFSAAIFHI